MPDFALGGGRCAQALKSMRLGRRASRKVHADLEMHTRIATLQNAENPSLLGFLAHP